MKLEAITGLFKAARAALSIATDYVLENRIAGKAADFLRKGREWKLWKIGKGPDLGGRS